MAREFLISSYLFIVRLFFNYFSQAPLEDKTVLIASFGDNINHVREACLDMTNHSLIILTTQSTKLNFKPSEREVIIPFETFKLLSFLRALKEIATAKVVFVDNYFGFLAATTFKKEVRVVQLWHAAGAIKQFGLQDPSIKTRAASAHKRFRAVYQSFTDVVVGSDKMARIFKQAFDLSNRQILKTGIPRTDFFFNQDEMIRARQHVLSVYPKLKDKKIILYAPTFRDSEIANFHLRLDLDKIRPTLGKDTCLLLRLHPVVVGKLHLSDDCIIDVSTYPKLNDLLIMTDLLITDYSSIPFEFALLQRPMIFYAYDLADYKLERGFYEDYTSLVPGPIATTTDDVIKLLSQNEWPKEKIQAFSQTWNQYSTGDSSRQLINQLYH